MRSLKRDSRGYPIPAFVLVPESGEPDLRVLDRAWWLYAVEYRRCGICGQPLGRHLAFVGGTASISNRLFTDLPMHVDCAQYALQACPFLAAPTFKYASSIPQLDGVATRMSEAVSDQRPTIYGMGVTRSFQVVVAGDNTPALLASAFERIEWWSKGARIDHSPSSPDHQPSH
ncbi:hypothetical protein [Ottowia sp.]|uniref:hypothetical protein n=1 Tax=Ottowia sp. TaxID=1898956 RepID=UPI0025D85D41|nr:hypothetical protein [Ottowia sp.]